MSEVLNKVNERAKAIAASAQAAIVFDDDNDATLPETWLAENLSEELSVDLIQKVQDEEAVFTSGISLGLGMTSLERMEKDENISRTSLTLPFGRNVIKAAVDRRVVNRIPATGEEREKFGDLTVKLESGAAAKRGDLKRVRVAVSDAFAAKFAK